MSDGGDLEENGHFQDRKCIAPKCFSSMGAILKKIVIFSRGNALYPNVFSSTGATLKKNAVYSKGNA